MMVHATKKSFLCTVSAKVILGLCLHHLPWLWVPVMHKPLCFGQIKLHSDSSKGSDGPPNTLDFPLNWCWYVIHSAIYGVIYNAGFVKQEARYQGFSRKGVWGQSTWLGRAQESSVLGYQIPEVALIAANLTELFLHPGQALSMLYAWHHWNKAPGEVPGRPGSTWCGQSWGL